MQKLWQLRVDWDEVVPSDIHSQWFRYKSELHILNNFQLSRNVILHTTEVIELCGFSDPMKGHMVPVCTGANHQIIIIKLIYCVQN